MATTTTTVVMEVLQLLATDDLFFSLSFVATFFCFHFHPGGADFFFASLLLRQHSFDGGCCQCAYVHNLFFKHFFSFIVLSMYKPVYFNVFFAPFAMCTLAMSVYLHEFSFSSINFYEYTPNSMGFLYCVCASTTLNIPYAGAYLFVVYARHAAAVPIALCFFIYS